MDNKKIVSELVKIAKSLVGKSRYKEGDLVKYKGKRTVYRVESEWEPHPGYYILRKMVKGKPTRVTTNPVEEADLAFAGETAIMEDKIGNTAAEAAKKLGKKLILTLSRMGNEYYGEVVGITKGGRIKVQMYLGGDYSTQELYTPTKKRKGKVVMFSPSLHTGKWVWESPRNSLYIKKPYKGGELDAPLT